MAKLQQIKRSNGSLSFSVNIPLELIEVLGWEKGVELNPEIQQIESELILVIRKEEN